MTKAAAIHQFFSSFGLPAYVSTSVPDGVEFPYLTYEFKTGAFGDTPVAITVNAYWYTESESIPNAWVEEFASRLGRGGILVRCEGGGVWIMRGSPFAQSVAYEDNTAIKRRYINIVLDWMTEY